ncbi:MAG: sugar ABC transporter ATP-binding protein [Nocardioidaceae bacterium]|nr:sugar ABC transporter ATP-binding protein [Nocardioidaceae bacterium]
MTATAETSPSATLAGPVLQTRAVTKSFGGVHALRGVDFSLAAGEVHALVGENGAGKSTLIKVLTGVYAPDGGELLYAGDHIRFDSPAHAQQQGISTIYQEVNLVPLLSVARNIFLGREPRGRFGLVDVAAMNEQAAALCERLQIQTDVTQDLGRLGLGAQQMVALARAVSTKSRVVIMDEPTSSLESREVATLFRVARELRDDGVGLAFVSHRLDELWELCDRVTVLRDGESVHDGPMADLTRLQLVSHMLGRSVDEVQRGGATEFGDSHLQGREPALKVRGIDVRNTLSSIDLDVRPGEVVGLGGLLGAGRSETVKAIYGALPTQHGEVSVNGTPVKSNSVTGALRAGIALLGEDRKAEGIVPELSVRDNIALAVLPRMSRLGIVSEAKIDAVVETFMRRLQIKASSPRQLVSRLSGGNQQKVLLARWLCTEPSVFLLDEPTRGIDVGAKSEVQGLIDELAEKGLAVVLISSEMDELVEGADKVVVLRDGHVVQELSGTDVSNSKLLAALAGGTGSADELSQTDAGSTDTNDAANKGGE